VTDAGRGLGEGLSDMAARVDHLAEVQSQSLDTLKSIAAVAGAREDARGAALEDALSDGFARLGQTMETAFAAYSSMLHVVVATLQQAAPASLPEAPEPAPPPRAAEDARAEEFRKRAGVR
jgi:hypothetical protein